MQPLIIYSTGTPERFYRLGNTRSKVEGLEKPTEHFSESVDAGLHGFHSCALVPTALPSAFSATGKEAPSGFPEPLKKLNPLTCV